MFGYLVLSAKIAVTEIDVRPGTDAHPGIGVRLEIDARPEIDARLEIDAAHLFFAVL